MRFLAAINTGRQMSLFPFPAELIELQCRRVKDFTLEANHRMPFPLVEREAASTAYSVSTWIWSEFNEIIPSKGTGPLDHSSMAQSWRGKHGGEASGVSRRAGTPLEFDRRPWESMGISRAWWYRKYRHAQK